jgi:dGTP triphosphohydrolase
MPDSETIKNQVGVSMKKRISEYISDYILKNAMDEEKIHSFAEFVENFFVDMDEELSYIKTAFHDEVKEKTEEVTEEMLMAVVENLKHKDGSHSGMKWTKEDVESVAKQYDVEQKMKSIGKKYCPLKFWFAMNYVYATHYSVSRTINGYIDLAIDEIANRNICFDDIVKRIFEKI